MKLMEKMKQKRMGNKGFSLVELIIVIAIMAILVGIVGTQVVPYIENSRKARDIQVFSGLVTDAMSAYSSQAAVLDPEEVYHIFISGDGSTAGNVRVEGGTTAEQTALLNAFVQLNNLNGNGGAIDTVSRAAGNITNDLDITCQNDDPMISLDPDGTGTDFDPITAN